MTTKDGGYTATAAITVSPVSVTGVTLSPQSATLTVGGSRQLTATVQPDNAGNQEVIWSSSDSEIVSVDASGLVTAKQAGKATITVTTQDGGYAATAAITVVSEMTEVSLDIVSETGKMLIGGKQQLQLNLDDELQPVSVNKQFQWSVVPEGVVEVSEYGVLTGLSVGEATISCTSKENAEQTASIEIKIEIPFTDIRLTDWQYPFVEYVYRNQLMGGKGTNVFDMNAELTRAEFVTILYSYSGKPEVTYQPDFSDVADKKWYTSAVIWAKLNNVSGGYANGKFGVSDNITRAQLVVMLYGYAKNSGREDTEVNTDLSSYSDADRMSSWAREAFAWAVQTGMVGGKRDPIDGTPTLDPLGCATRGECAAIMKGFMEFMK